MRTKKQPQGHVIQNCVFTGVKIEGEAISVMRSLADALVQNAKAVQSMAEMLKMGGAGFEAAIKFTGEDLTIFGKK